MATDSLVFDVSDILWRFWSPSTRRLGLDLFLLLAIVDDAAEVELLETQNCASQSNDIVEFPGRIEDGMLGTCLAGAYWTRLSTKSVSNPGDSHTIAIRGKWTDLADSMASQKRTDASMRVGT